MNVPAPEYYFVNEAPSVRTVAVGLKWLVEWGDRTTPGTIIVPTKRGFEYSDLSAVLGEPAAKVLVKGNVLRLVDRLVRGYTQRTLPQMRELGPTLLLWPTKKLLAQTQDAQFAALCVVPWLLDEVAAWTSATGATDLLTNRAAKLSTIADPVVDAAIVSLSRRVNLSTGLVHPSDKAAAVGMFRILKSARYRWSGEEIAARATQLGWKATDAQELGRMADGMMQGRRYQAPGARETWAKDILKQWEARAKKS